MMMRKVARRRKRPRQGRRFIYLVMHFIELKLTLPRRLMPMRMMRKRNPNPRGRHLLNARRM
jgi:hypothetical protein